MIIRSCHAVSYRTPFHRAAAFGCDRRSYKAAASRRRFHFKASLRRRRVHPPGDTAVPTHRSDFVRTLAERGFIHQCTDLDGLDLALSGPPRVAYIGFDATADSLHTGHLMQIMPLRWLQRCGHKPIVLIGGGTTRIGDPSFRNSSRPLLDDVQIAANVAGLRQIFDRYLTFGDKATDAVLVNNADWLDTLHFIPFLRDVGRHFSVNRMLSFDSVRTRLDREEPLSLLEFNYMILQAFDFLELSRRHGCVLQMGGSDQWGNIVNGMELGRRVDQRQLFGLTTPLLTTASGTKMGKTAGGAIWLNAARLAPYGFWQFWRNTEDADVGRFLRCSPTCRSTRSSTWRHWEGQRSTWPRRSWPMR